MRYEYHARTSQDYPKMNPAHIVRIGYNETGPRSPQSMEITDLSSLNWVHDGEIIDDIYRGMIDYDSITEAQAETILARWRATRVGTTGTLEQGGHEMTVIGQVGLTTIIVGVRDGEGGGEAVIVDLPAEEVRGPRSLYSIEGRMKVEDITLDDTQVELALRLAEQYMKP